MDDLTNKKAVIKLMVNSTSEAEWNQNCDKVKQANNGNYPEWWYQEIIMGGVLRCAKNTNCWN